MYETAKSLEIVEVEVYGCFILCPYLFLHKTLILCNVTYRENTIPFYSSPSLSIRKISFNLIFIIFIIFVKIVYSKIFI